MLCLLTGGVIALCYIPRLTQAGLTEADYISSKLENFNFNFRTSRFPASLTLIHYVIFQNKESITVKRSDTDRLNLSVHVCISVFSNIFRRVKFS